jgi:hypothetical protein
MGGCRPDEPDEEGRRSLPIPLDEPVVAREKIATVSVTRCVSLVPTAGSSPGRPRARAARAGDPSCAAGLAWDGGQGGQPRPSDCFSPRGEAPRSGLLSHHCGTRREGEVPGPLGLAGRSAGGHDLGRAPGRLVRRHVVGSRSWGARRLP